MQHKYGEYPDFQFQDYKKRMHSWVHFLLIYAEQKSEILDDYFSIVQTRFSGLNELLNYPPCLIEIMNLVESARLEFNSSEFSHKKYRKLVLDIHDLIDKICEENDRG